MKVVRWNSPLDAFFNDFLNAVPSAIHENDTEHTIPTARPALDIVDGDEQTEVWLNLPGINPDDVNIEFNKGVLTISTTVSDTAEETTANYTRRERFYGAYKRSLRVADTIDTENATANFENGVLHLTLPKKPEAQPLRIPVSVSKN